MKVFVTGGTGYVGPAVVREMLAEGHDVVVLEHNRPVPVDDTPRLHRRKGDVRDRKSLQAAMEGCDAVCHLVAVLKEDAKRGVTFQRVHVDGARNVVEAAKARGIKRFLLMTANGTDDRDTPYFATKWEMERMVKEAAFDWTIFRPSYVSGTGEHSRDAKEGSRGTDASFDEMFAGIVDKSPVLPAFSGGHFEIQPVSRRNVAQAFARALARPRTVGQTYVLVGPERFTWREYLRRLSAVRGKRRLIAWAPTPVIMGVASVAPGFPATADQIRMLVRGSVGDPGPAVRDLDLTLDTWEEAVASLRRSSDARR